MLFSFQITLVVLIALASLPRFSCTDCEDDGTCKLFLVGQDYVFYGDVHCWDEKMSMGDGRVILKEDDYFYDDNYGEAMLFNHEFQLGISKKESDKKTANLELYLIFKNFCGTDAEIRTGDLRDNTWTSYVIYSNNTVIAKND